MTSYSPSKKVEIIKRHVLEGKSVSEVCEEYGIKPKRYYEWQKKFFDEGEIVFSQPNSSSSNTERKQEAKIKQLEAKLNQKNEVVSELMEEHVKLKKSLGVS